MKLSNLKPKGYLLSWQLTAREK